MKRRNANQLELFDAPLVTPAVPERVTPAPEPDLDPLTSEIFLPLDRHFARFMEKLSGRSEPRLALAAALASRARHQGDPCLDLRVIAGKRFPSEATSDGRQIQLPGLKPWFDELLRTGVVGRPGEVKPLILDGASRLYLHRYWEYETNLATSLRTRAGNAFDEVDRELLERGLKRFFPAAANKEVDWQQVAARTAVERRLCIISGGPGTGKTRTVGIILALLLEQAGQRPVRIALAAPTGKAAARLQEALKTLKTNLDCEESVRGLLPEEAFTVHRLLGGIPGSVAFRHDANNLLPFDVVVVDEASMVDLALMAKLFAALPSTARVILLGDKDQLASVEAGAVLSEICNGDSNNSLGPCVVELRRNYRFSTGSGHGLLPLSKAINEGDAGEALRVLGSQSAEALEGTRGVTLPSSHQLKAALRESVVTGFSQALRASEPAAALATLNRFRILAATRHGPHGVENLNALVEQILAEAKVIAPASKWYSGRPVMVTQNDYNLKLFNGDVGILLPDPATGEMRAWFAGPDQQPRAVLPLRLPAHETVFAMTVHKSQGSEFDSVLLVLPDVDSPVVTRELIYTGVTRARSRVEVWFKEELLRAAIQRRVQRASGLRDALKA